MDSPQFYIEVFRLLLFAGLLGWAAYSDLTEGRIPNWLVVAGLVIAPILAIAVYAPADGLRHAAIGCFTGGGVLMLIYLVGVATRKPLMGAGDVKLMAAVGAFGGPLGALTSLYYALLVSGAAALGLVLVQVLRHRPIPKTLPFGAFLCFGTGIALLLRITLFSPLLDRLS